MGTPQQLSEVPYRGMANRASDQVEIEGLRVRCLRWWTIVSTRQLSSTKLAAAQENMMKAIVQAKYGPPDDVLRLRDIDKPVVKDDEVLVRVHAASVHPDIGTP